MTSLLSDLLINGGLGLGWDFQTSHKAQGFGLHRCRSSLKTSSGYESFQLPSELWETVIWSWVIPPINYFFSAFHLLGWIIWSASSKNEAIHPYLLSQRASSSNQVLMTVLQEVATAIERKFFPLRSLFKRMLNLIFRPVSVRPLSIPILARMWENLFVPHVLTFCSSLVPKCLV